MTSGASGIATEIRDVRNMLDSRSTVAGSKKSDELEVKYATSIASKIGRIDNLSLAESSILYSATKEAGLTDSAVAILTLAIDTQLEQAADDDDAKVAKSSTKNQLHLWPCLWMTASLVSAMQSRLIFDTKLLVMAEFLVKIGCLYPHEQTYKRWLAVAILLHYENQFPRYQTIFSWLGKFKQAVKDSRKKFTFPLQPEFPKTPQGLQDAVFKHCYEEADPPVPIALERYNVVVNGHIPLRKNSKLITREKAAERTAETRGGHIEQPRGPPLGAYKPVEIKAEPALARDELAGVATRVKTEPVSDDRRAAWAKRLMGLLDGVPEEGFVPRTPKSETAIPIKQEVDAPAQPRLNRETVGNLRPRAAFKFDDAPEEEALLYFVYICVLFGGVVT